jgi:hypothetical protein
MTLKINNIQSFVTDFLTPVSKVNENCILKITKTGYQTIVTSADNSLILYAVYEQETGIEDTLSLNIADIGKLVKILNCLAEEDINLLFKGNNLQYESDDINFTYHLLAEGILNNPGIDIKKINDLDFDFTFNIPGPTIINLIKGSTFTTETNKIYFYTKDNAVYGQLTDLQKQNVDVYSQKISDKYTGDDLNEPIPVSFELIRSISSLRSDSVNTQLCKSNKVFLFNSNRDTAKLTYIASAFVN